MVTTQAIKVKSIDSKTQSVFNKIDRLDLEPIKYKLMHRHSSDSWTLEKCDEVENLLKMYLKLAYLYPESGVVPTEEIDGMWHAWILDTTKYMSDCDQIFGYYLHHYPYLGLRGSDDEIALEKSFEQTRALFEEHFGVKLCEDYEASSCRDDCISLHLNPMFIEGNELNPVEFFNTQQRPRPIRK